MAIAAIDLSEFSVPETVEEQDVVDTGFRERTIDLGRQKFREVSDNMFGAFCEVVFMGQLVSKVIRDPFESKVDAVGQLLHIRRWTDVLMMEVVERPPIPMIEPEEVSTIAL